MEPGPNFGRRGLKGPPPGRPPAPPSRRMRSNIVVVGAVGLLAAGLGGAAAYQRHRCQPPLQGEPDQRPQWCFGHSSGYSGGGRGGWGLSSGGESSGAAHASFGGFGAHGAGHGGGT